MASIKSVRQKSEKYEDLYMKWKIFYYLLAAEKSIGEMCFIFSDDKEKTEHYLGYTADWDEPYWIGCCDIKKLQGTAGYRLRIGNFRILFNVDGIIIDIIDIGNRGQIYKGV